jgi:hypothetical protein
MTASALPFVLDRHEIDSFAGRRYVARPLAGMTLYRLLGRSARGGWNSAFGRKCWFDERVFFDCACADDSSAGDPARALSSLRFLLRDRLAVAAEWNDFRSFVVLRVPRERPLVAATGAAAAQPYMVDGRGPGRQLGPLILAGGAMQYIVDVGRDMSRWLVGPQPLAVARA